MALWKKVKIKAYTDARHNMTTDQNRAAFFHQENKVREAKEQLEYEQDVLEGYQQALVERSKKKA